MERIQNHVLYESVGLDYARGVERFSGDEALYRAYLERFLYDHSFEEYRMALEMGELRQAFQALYTLKGMAGNLELSALFEAADRQSLAVAEGAALETIHELTAEVEMQYHDACALILREFAP